jgi:hypothetical protein
MDSERQKLIDRILALLALADSTAFAGEAASAREITEKLITKHNVTLTEGAKDRTRFEVELHAPWAKGAQWEFMIAAALANLCGCAPYYHAKFARFKIAGTVADLEVWRYMMSEISNQRIRAWLDYKKSDGPDNLWAFCFAYAQALRGKIDDLLVAAPAIAEAREKARLWFESRNVIDRDHNDDWIDGRGSSSAGREAGAGAALIRGRVGQRQQQISYRK